MYIPTINKPTTEYGLPLFVTVPSKLGIPSTILIYSNQRHCR